MRLVNRIKAPETNGEFAILKSENSEHWIEINAYAGHPYKSGDELDHIAFEVEDLEAALAELKSKGIKPIYELRQTPWSKWTYISDPDGIWIELFQAKRAITNKLADIHQIQKPA